MMVLITVKLIVVLKILAKFILKLLHKVYLVYMQERIQKLVRRWRIVEGAAITIKKRFSKRIQGARTPLFSLLPRKN
jgi:hypothetical protein